MKVPVIADDGCTYDNNAVTEWLTSTRRSSTTNPEITFKHLVFNKALRKAIDEWRSQGFVQNISDLDDFELDRNEVPMFACLCNWTLAIMGQDKNFSVNLELLSRKSDFFFRVKRLQNETDGEIRLHTPATVPEKEVRTQPRAFNKCRSLAHALTFSHRSSLIRYCMPPACLSSTPMS
jgi:hypothetical protein